MNIIKASHITPLCLEILITIYDICDFTDKYLSHFNQGNVPLKELENYAKYCGYYHSQALYDC